MASVCQTWRNSVCEVFALLCVILAIGLPRALALDRFVTPDEPLWLYRSANFYYALAHLDFPSTFQKEHPGVTTMWAGTAGFIARFRQYRAGDLGQVNLTKFHHFLNKSADIKPLELLTTSRFFMVLGNSIALLLCYFYTKRLIGLLPALTAYLLISFDPFHLALSRLLHVDGLLSNLLLLSLLAYLNHRQRHRTTDLLVSGAAAGFAWLTKSPGLFILPVIVILQLRDWYANIPLNKDSFFQLLYKSILRPLAVWGMAGMVIFVIFWPAMWTDPLLVLSKTLTTAMHYAESGHDWPIFFNGTVFQNGAIGLDYFYYYPLTYLWHSTPPVLVGLLLAGLASVVKRSPFNQPSTRLVTLGLCLFILIYSILISLSIKKMERYLLPVYAPLDVLAGLGWVALYKWLKEKTVFFKHTYGTFFLIPVILLQAIGTMQTYPYYFSYYNPLVGGSRIAPEVMQVGWGEGLDQAARYLNEKPNANNLRVLSWYGSGPFSYYFKGLTTTMEFPSPPPEVLWEVIKEQDYIAFYINQMQRDYSPEVMNFFATQTPETTIIINGVEYVHIYQIH